MKLNFKKTKKANYKIENYPFILNENGRLMDQLISVVMKKDPARFPFYEEDALKFIRDDSFKIKLSNSENPRSVVKNHIKEVFSDFNILHWTSETKYNIYDIDIFAVEDLQKNFGVSEKMVKYEVKEQVEIQENRLREVG